MYLLTILDTLQREVLAIAALVVAVGAISGAIVWLARLFRKTSQFLDDWNGQPARPGVDAHPGVLERLSRMEVRQLVIEAIVTPNGGASLADAVNRIDGRTENVEKLIGSHITDGRIIVETGVANDKVLWETLKANGIDVPAYTEVPQEILYRNAHLLEGITPPEPKD